MTSFRAGLSCQVVAFEVDDPWESQPKRWIATAIGLYYDEGHIVPPLNRSATIATAEVIRRFEGRGIADTQSGAIAVAVDLMLEQFRIETNNKDP